ncbi:glycosyltransferase [Fusobacterium sp. SYSU M8D902]|uniref:glycosyltransferase n=1 Tax=Fusobacterium sp. SYSU M8D902 TaxID=3159562 RepID=UPI0032E39C3D
MQNEVLVSIIVPIYNSEKWLKFCLDSILTQNYKNFELILINDGSKDSSGIICDNYAKRDSRIKVYHKKNEGVSAARNDGIKYSQGKYIQFLDSDDIIKFQMTKGLVELAERENADIVMCDFEILNEIEISNYIFQPILGVKIGKMNKLEAMKNILRIDGYQGFLWNKLLKKELLNMNKEIRFDNGISICEDLLFCCKYLSQANKIVYTSEKLYGYVQHENSLSHKIDKKILTSIEANRQIAIIYDKFFLPEGRSRYIYSIVNLFTMINFDVIKNKKKYLEKEIKEKKNWFKPKLHTRKECFVYYFLIMNPYLCGYIYIILKKIYKVIKNKQKKGKNIEKNKSY